MYTQAWSIILSKRSHLFIIYHRKGRGRFYLEFLNMSYYHSGVDPVARYKEKEKLMKQNQNNRSNRAVYLWRKARYCVIRKQDLTERKHGQ